jgi:hypothetical protein
MVIDTTIGQPYSNTVMCCYMYKKVLLETLETQGISVAIDNTCNTK